MNVVGLMTGNAQISAASAPCTVFMAAAAGKLVMSASQGKIAHVMGFCDITKTGGHMAVFTLGAVFPSVNIGFIMALPTGFGRRFKLAIAMAVGAQSQGMSTVNFKVGLLVMVKTIAPFLVMATIASFS